MEFIVHRGQDGEKIFNLTSLSQPKSWDKIQIMDALDGWGQMTHGTSIALKFNICVKHGISNNFQHWIL